jgi:hypothetical protein
VLDTDKKTGKRINISAEENWGVFRNFNPNIKATGSNHADINTKWLNVENNSDLDVGMTGAITGSSYTLYYQEPGSGNLAMYLKSGNVGTVLQTITGIAKDFTAQNINRKISGNVPDEIAKVETTIGDITYATDTTGTSGNKVYALYVPDGSTNPIILFKDSGGITLFTYSYDENIVGDKTLSLGKFTGAVHTDLDEKTIKFFENTACDNNDRIQSVDITPSGDSYTGYLITKDNAGAIANFYPQITDGSFATCGADVGGIGGDRTKTINFDTLVSGAVPTGVISVFVDIDGDGAFDVGTEPITQVVGSNYKLYLPTPGTKNVIFASNDNGTGILLSRSKGLTSATTSLDVARVHGLTANVHGELKSGGRVLVIYDTANPATALSSATVDLNADYNQYFEVPSGAGPAVNIEVKQGVAGTVFFYVYNKTVAAGGSYLFEPLKKITSTVHSDVKGIEISKSGNYTYRDNTIDAGVYDIYVDSTGAGEGYTYKAYDNNFANVLLTRGGKNTGVDGTWTVNRLTTGAAGTHTLLADQAASTMDVYAPGNCTTTKLSSENVSMISGGESLQYYEPSNPGTHDVWIRVLYNNGAEGFVTCINTEALQAAAGGSNTYALDESLRTYVPLGITKVEVDPDKDGTYEIVSETIEGGGEPYSAYLFFTKDGDANIRFSTSGGVVLTRTGKNFSDGTDTFEVARLTSTPHNDINDATDDWAICDGLPTAEFGGTLCNGVNALSETTGNNGNTMATTGLYFERSGANAYIDVFEDDVANRHSFARLDGVTAGVTINKNMNAKITGNTATQPAAIDLVWIDDTTTANVGNIAEYAGETDGSGNYAIYYDSSLTAADLVATTLRTVATPELSRTKATLPTEFYVGSVYGNLHANIQAVADAQVICDTDADYTDGIGTCATPLNSVTAGSGAATYAKYFEMANNPTDPYWLRTYDSGNSTYTYSKLAAVQADRDIQIHLDARFTGEIRESYDTSVKVGSAAIRAYGDQSMWTYNNTPEAAEPDNAKITALTYSKTDGVFWLYGDDADNIWDVMVAKDGYIRQNAFTNDGGGGRTPDMDNIDIDQAGFNVGLVSGVKIIVREYDSNVLVTRATVTLYSCSSTDPDDCNVTTPKTGCTNPVGGCTRTGNNTAGNGLSGEYYFAGLEAGKHFMIKIEKEGFNSIVDPNPNTGDGVAYTVSSTAVEPNTTRGSDTYYLKSAPLTVEITAPVAGAVVSGDSVEITATNGSHYQVDGGSWVTIATPWNTTAVANGTRAIRAKGTIGGVTVYSEIVYVTVENVDTDPPELSSVSVTDTSQNGVTIRFTSNEAGSAKVGYGLSASHGMMTSWATMNVGDENAIALTGLTCGTEYHYTVYGKDAVGNESNTENAEFTTSACDVEEVTTPFVDVPVAKVQKETFEFDSWVNGHEWRMLVTIPDAHNGFALRFDKWISGGNEVNAADNMRYYSEEITAGPGSQENPVNITANSTYPDYVTINPVKDAYLNRAGIQTYIRVLWKVPGETPTGNYSTKFRVRTDSVMQ